MSHTTAAGLTVSGNATSLTFAGLKMMAAEQWRRKVTYRQLGLLYREGLAMGQLSQTYPIHGKRNWAPTRRTAPGTTVTGKAFNQHKTTITLGDPEEATHFVGIEERELDAIVPKSAARAVKDQAQIFAEFADRRMHRVHVLAARAASFANVHDGGIRINRVAASLAAAYPLSETGAANLMADIQATTKACDDRDYPKSGRVLELSPYLSQVAKQSPKAFNMDYQPGAASPNSIIEGRFARFDGWEIYESNHIPSGVISTGTVNAAHTADEADYAGDFSAAGGGQPAFIAGIQGMEWGPIGLIETPLGFTVLTDDRENNPELASQYTTYHRYRIGALEVYGAIVCDVTTT